MSEGIVRQPQMSRRQIGLQMHVEQAARAVMRRQHSDAYTTGINLARAPFVAIIDGLNTPEIAAHLAEAAEHFSRAADFAAGTRRSPRVKESTRREIAKALIKLSEDLPVLTQDQAIERVMEINSMVRSGILKRNQEHKATLTYAVTAPDAQYQAWKANHRDYWDIAVVARLRGDYETAIEYTLKDGKRRADDEYGWHSESMSVKDRGYIGMMGIRRGTLRTALDIAMEAGDEKKVQEFVMKLAGLEDVKGLSVEIKRE